MRGVFSRSLIVLSLFPFCGIVQAVEDRISATQKGSLLIYSKVELKWTGQRDGSYRLTQDTFLTLHNDYPHPVDVQLIFVNGDPPLPAVCDPQCTAPTGPCPQDCRLEREHPGWNFVDCLVSLTDNQPMYLSAATGGRLGCAPFTTLDPGSPPGRPDPDALRSRGRVLRGFVYAWAVKPDRLGRDRNLQIRWNHLSGDASLINYQNASQARYNAYAAQVVHNRLWSENGDYVGQGGVIKLDGEQYQNCFNHLHMDFYAAGSGAYSSADTSVQISTDLTLHVVDADLRQDGSGPVATKARFEIWNENELRFSETQRCITCWDQTLLLHYENPNHFLLSILQTDKGNARIDGIASQTCAGSTDAALLGVSIEQLVFRPLVLAGPSPARILGRATGAINLQGSGLKNATIRYDLHDDGGTIPPAPDREPGVRIVPDKQDR